MAWLEVTTTGAQRGASQDQRQGHPGGVIRLEARQVTHGSRIDPSWSADDNLARAGASSHGDTETSLKQHLVDLAQNQFLGTRGEVAL